MARKACTYGGPYRCLGGLPGVCFHKEALDNGVAGCEQEKIGSLSQALTCDHEPILDYSLPKTNHRKSELRKRRLDT